MHLLRLYIVHPLVRYCAFVYAYWSGVLANAKAAADKNPGTYVFTNDGVAIYPVEGATESGTGDYRIHTVVKGDTLWDIAALYLGKGSRYPEIKTLNGLKSNVIYSGWKLKIPN